MYDDGDEEWLDLARQRHELLPHSSNDSATGSAGGGGKSVARAAKAGTRRSAARRRAVLASDSEEDAAGAESGSNGGSDDSDFDGACTSVRSRSPPWPASTLSCRTSASIPLHTSTMLAPTVMTVHTATPCSCRL